MKKQRKHRKAARQRRTFAPQFSRDAGNARNSAETQTRKPSHKRGPRKPSLRADRRWIEVGGLHWVEKATARTRRRK